ncbi:uncharacterized protein LOC134533461 [Bacillus rossius redtenbacheri]|uniref:uncharacterized protein LOC134533461 n=1 Tax=Bacillus rossius redtenbacheri TaxID=93214 RepID=UPI002FDEB506
MTQHASPLPHTANNHAAIEAKMPPTLRTTETSICHSSPPPTSPPTPPPPYGVETSPQAEGATPFQPLWYNWHAGVGWKRQADADPPPPTPPPVSAQVPTETAETNDTERHSKGGGYVNWAELTRSTVTPPTLPPGATTRATSGVLPPAAEGATTCTTWGTQPPAAEGATTRATSGAPPLTAEGATMRSTSGAPPPATEGATRRATSAAPPPAAEGANTHATSNVPPPATEGAATPPLPTSAAAEADAQVPDAAPWTAAPGLPGGAEDGIDVDVVRVCLVLVGSIPCASKPDLVREASGLQGTSRLVAPGQEAVGAGLLASGSRASASGRKVAGTWYVTVRMSSGPGQVPG